MLGEILCKEYQSRNSARGCLFMSDTVATYLLSGWWRLLIIVHRRFTLYFVPWIWRCSVHTSVSKNQDIFWGPVSFIFMSRMCSSLLQRKDPWRSLPRWNLFPGWISSYKRTGSVSSCVLPWCCVAATRGSICFCVTRDAWMTDATEQVPKVPQVPIRPTRSAAAWDP